MPGPRVVGLVRTLVLGAAVSGCTTSYTAQPLADEAIAAQLDRPVELPEPAPAAPRPAPLRWERPPSEDGTALSLTLPQAQAVALLRHPSLARLRAERGFAGAADLRAGTLPDPEISLTALWISPQSVLGVVSSLRWELLAPGTRDARRGLAGALRGAIDAHIAAAEWRVAQDARIAWLTVARDARAVALAEHALDLARETRAFGRSMLERGAATQVETAVLELAAAEAEREVVARRGALVASRARLAEALGLPPHTRAEAAADDGDPLAPVEPVVPSGDPDELLATRLPELREARARYAVAEHELELAHLGALPKIAVGPDFQTDADSTFAGGGVDATLPIFDGNRAGIAEADTRRHIASLAYAEALFTARAAVAAARTAEENAMRALALHRQSVAPLAEQALASAQRAVDVGAADLTTLLLARQRALEAERVGLDLCAAHAIATAQLEAAFGPAPEAREGDAAPAQENDP